MLLVHHVFTQLWPIDAMMGLFISLTFNIFSLFVLRDWRLNTLLEFSWFQDASSFSYNTLTHVELHTVNEVMDCVQVSHAFPQRTSEVMTVFVFRNSMNSSKRLLNNVAAPRLVTYHIQQSTLLQWQQSLRDTVWETCVILYGVPADVWRPQSILWNLGSCPTVQKKIPNPDSFIHLTCRQHFCLSVSPCGFSCLFFNLCPSTLHSCSSLVTRPDWSDTAILPPSPSSSLPTFVLSFLLSFPVLLLAHLSCGCLCIIILGRDDLGQNDLHISDQSKQNSQAEYT